ncbi:hypothetical protein ACJX0J_025933 [Zea mays]
MYVRYFDVKFWKIGVNIYLGLINLSRELAMTYVISSIITIFLIFMSQGFGVSNFLCLLSFLSVSLKNILMQIWGLMDMGPYFILCICLWGLVFDHGVDSVGISEAAIAISVTEVTQVHSGILLLYLDKLNNETKEVMELSKQIRQKMKDIDAFDLEGNTEGKIRATEELDKLKEQRAEEQAKMLLEAFNKDRASLINSLQNATQTTTPVPPAAPDARTQEMINEKLKKAEELGENGMVDEAQKLLDEAEALKKLATRPQAVPDSTKMSAHVQITDQKLRLCDICGAFLSVYDSDRRLADHFGGKLHMGYMLIRERLSELQEEKNKKRKLDRAEYDRRSRERSGERARDSSRDRYIDRSSSRDREYDRRRSHDRYHDRERERDSRQSRSYDSRSHRRSYSPRGSSRDYDRSG